MTEEESIQLDQQIEKTKELIAKNQEAQQTLIGLRKKAMVGTIAPEEIKWLVRELMVATTALSNIYPDWLAADESAKAGAR